MTMAPDSPGSMTTTPTRGDTRPIPDPTVLTTQQLYREIAALRELFETHFREYDRAIEILQATTARSPTPGEIDGDLVGFKMLVDQKFATVDEKFSTVNQKFATVDKEFGLNKEYTTQSAIDRKEELKTALSAAEKAVDKNAASFTSATDKSEKATGELLRQQAELLRTTKEGLDSQVADLKVRLATAEATASAAREAAAVASANASAAASAATASRRDERVDSRGNAGFNLSLAVAMISAAGFVLLLIRDFRV